MNPPLTASVCDCIKIFIFAAVPHSHVEAVRIKLISASISHQINPEWNLISTDLNDEYVRSYILIL